MTSLEELPRGGVKRKDTFEIIGHLAQDDPAVFWPIVAVSSAASVAMFGAVYGYWRFWPNRRHEKRVLDLKALRDLLLYHVDDLEDIMAALKSRHDSDLRARLGRLLKCFFVSYFVMFSVSGCRTGPGAIGKWLVIRIAFGDALVRARRPETCSALAEYACQVWHMPV